MLILVKELRNFPSDPQVGDLVYRTDLGRVFFYNGNEWQEKEYDGTLPEKYVSKDEVTLCKYLARDFWEFVNELRIRLKEKYPNYEDWLESDLGMAFIDVVAYGLSQLAWYQDKIASELFIDTAVLAKNVYRLARQLGYTPRKAVPARCSVFIELFRPYSFDVILRKGHKFYAGDLVFELENDVKILASQIEPEQPCVVVEGETHKVNYISSGEPLQTFRLKTGKSKLTQVRVVVGNEEWNEVDNWTYTNGKEYRVFYEEGMVMFGDGIVAKIPVKGETIAIEYRVCQGSRGNIAENQIKKTDGVIKYGELIPIKVKGNTKGTGGADEESVAEIKTNVKKNYLSQDRAVSLEDFEKMILSFEHPLGRIVRVKGVVCRGINDDAYLLKLLERVKKMEKHVAFREYQGTYRLLKSYLDGFFSSRRSVNLVLFYLLSQDEQGRYVSPPQEYLLDSDQNPLLRYINSKKIASVQVKFLDGMEFVQAIKVNVRIKVLPQFDFYETKEKVIQSITQRVNSLDFGEALRISDVYGVIEKIEGVDYCYVNLEPGTEAERVHKNSMGDLEVEGGWLLGIENLQVIQIT